jgi:hypothetical protein
MMHRRLGTAPLIHLEIAFRTRAKDLHILHPRAWSPKKQQATIFACNAVGVCHFRTDLLSRRVQGYRYLLEMPLIAVFYISRNRGVSTCFILQNFFKTPNTSNFSATKYKSRERQLTA